MTSPTPHVADAAVRVTHVVGDLHEGGYETLIADMARRFAGTPVALSAITLSGRAGRIGSQISPLLARYEILRPVRGLSMALPLGLARAIRRTAADVVHVHSGCWYKGAMGASLAGVKGVVFTEHGREHHDPPLARWLDRLAARRTDRVVAVSDRLGAYLERTLGVPHERVRIIQNGVDTERFSPREASTDAGREANAPPGDAARALGLPANAWVIGSIGRLDPVKAYERLIDAVAALRALPLERPVVGVIWGEGPERAALEARIASQGLTGAFLLPGWTNDAVGSHTALDVFALTSHSEGASVSLMESMSCGVAPVVTNVGANAEVAGPELRDQVVPAGDEAALRSTIAATLTDRERRMRAGLVARARIKSSYSLDVMLARYESLYRELARPAQ